MLTVRDKRNKLNISQNELAKMINVNQTAISQWERGVTIPSLPNARRLASALRCTMDELFENEKEVG